MFFINFYQFLSVCRLISSSSALRLNVSCEKRLVQIVRDVQDMILNRE